MSGVLEEVLRIARCGLDDARQVESRSGDYLAAAESAVANFEVVVDRLARIVETGPLFRENEKGQFEAVAERHAPLIGWHVEDNVTGSRESREYDSIEGASHVCRALNLQAGPGGRYGVYNEKGERVP